MSEQGPEQIQETPDQKILKNVITEWRTGAGAGIVTPSILSVLENLMAVHQEKVTVDGACDALDSLSRVALKIKETLKSEQGKVNLES
ncbi:MAG TPA: hypothetical protein VJH67_03900 [Candidatus Paceibacterota bacterium]